MKRLLIAIFAISLLVLSGCAPDADSVMESFIPYNENGIYSGFSDMPKRMYTAQEAENAGCFVSDKTAEDRGRDVWEQFLKDTSEGKQAKIRIVHVFEEETFVKDLYFDGEFYYCFYEEEPELVCRCKHLLVLSGKWESWQEENSVVILTNDPEITYRDFMWSLVSSNSEDWVDATLLFFD